MYTHDYIIIGQGLAGTSIAQQLVSRNNSFAIFDQKIPNQASRIASGIWNPVVLKRMKKVWLADDMLTELGPFYIQAQELFQENFMESSPVFKRFTTAEQTNEWVAISDKPPFESIIDSQIKTLDNREISSPFGFGEVKLSGRIDTEKWLDAARTWFVEKSLLFEEHFIYENLQIDEGSVKYGEITARGIIFCEGMSTTKSNPYFHYLPFALTKGEVLEIESSTLKLDKILNSGVFILPLGNNRYKVGATYNWREISPNTTKEARNELVEKLNKIISAPYEIVNQKAGIRPTTRDRRPFLGSHPIHQNVHIFNGMGSRGVLMVPYLSKVFADYLLDGKSFPLDANIERYRKMHPSNLS